MFTFDLNNSALRAACELH